MVRIAGENNNVMRSGGVSRSIAGTLLMPATVIKIRFESGLYAYSGILSAFSNFIRYLFIYCWILFSKPAYGLTLS
jgi:hypothetical protein